MSETVIYKDPGEPIEKRIEDLLSRMTLEEKIGQLMQLDGREHIDKLEKQHIGSFLQVNWEDIASLIERADKTRLQIPIIFGNDSIHGFSFWKDATIFPTQLGASCSWNEELIGQMARVTAKESSNTGCAWTFSPVLCITRDLRWGRVGETFGEDPFLIGRFAAAMIKGYQGDDLTAEDSILACAKHYAGYSETLGGRDASEADLSKRKLTAFFLPPFQKAVEAGVVTFMTGYQSMEGLPSTANKWLLRDVLKDEWGFDGFLVTDWNNVGHMVENQKTCKDYVEAAAIAVEAGNEMIMSTPAFYEGAIEAVTSDKLKIEFVDDAVKRILRAKFRLGLFENPRIPDWEKVKKNVGTAENRNVALELARESAVLLSNNDCLPLNKNKINKIAVIGPNADNHLAQLGDWSLGSGQACPGEHSKDAVVTILDGIKNSFDGDVAYARGCGIINDDLEQIEEAVAAAEGSDVAVVVVGDEKGLMGEHLSTATLELQGGQLALLQAVRDTGVPTVVVLIHSKPMVLPETVTTAGAVVELFNPGMLGGQAFAEILFGEINPCGKLTVSVPRHVGQQPVFYNVTRGQHGTTYADMTQDPQYVFGHGLSYTKYKYSNARLNKKVFEKGETLAVVVDVTNEGSHAGIEIVQAYIYDLVVSATWPEKELKGFARVKLEPGETKAVTINIPIEECSIVNVAGQRVVEDGDFECLLGPSSKDSDLIKLPFEVKP